MPSRDNQNRYHPSAAVQLQRGDREIRRGEVLRSQSQTTCRDTTPARALTLLAPCLLQTWNLLPASLSPGRGNMLPSVLLGAVMDREGLAVRSPLLGSFVTHLQSIIHLLSPPHVAYHFSCSFYIRKVIFPHGFDRLFSWLVCNWLRRWEDSHVFIIRACAEISSSSLTGYPDFDN